MKLLFTLSRKLLARPCLTNEEERQQAVRVIGETKVVYPLPKELGELITWFAPRDINPPIWAQHRPSCPAETQYLGEHHLDGFRVGYGVKGQSLRDYSRRNRGEVTLFIDLERVIPGGNVESVLESELCPTNVPAFVFGEDELLEPARFEQALKNLFVKLVHFGVGEHGPSEAQSAANGNLKGSQP